MKNELLQILEQIKIDEGNLATKKALTIALLAEIENPDISGWIKVD